MNTVSLLEGSLNPSNVISVIKHDIEFRKEHPDYFELDGLLTFCGGQGSGKTLSAVQYVKKVLNEYPKCILCSNVEIKDLPEHIRQVPYRGVESFASVSNGYEGVLYFVDEIQNDFNCLESKYIDIRALEEFSQQRKQRKHIVGTAQVYGRIAKPLREQMKNVVICKNYFKVLQKNCLIDGDNTKEVNGKLVTDIRKTYWWFHSADLYESYDTFQKMHRYSKNWKGKNTKSEVW